MSSRIPLYIVSFLSATILASCSVTRNIPEGSYVLTENKIVTDSEMPRTERISSTEIGKFVKQRPAPDLFGIRVWIYEKADPEKQNWWNNLLRTLGTCPVVLDTTLTRRSADNIEAYIASRGFFGAKEDYSFEFDHRRRTAKAVYTTVQGQPYRIANVNCDFRDTFIEKLLSHDSLSLVRRGEILDLNVLGEERKKVAADLRNRGYYNFSVSNIDFLVDTTVGDHKADVTMLVKQNVTGYDTQGLPVAENNMVYRIGRVNVFPDYDATKAATDTSYLNSLDTLDYRGLGIIYHGRRPNLRPAVLRKLVLLQPGALYSESRVANTYDNLMRVDYLRSANILFSEMPGTTKQEVTFIGDHWSETIDTNEGELACEIRLAPAQSQNYKVELEASSTSSFYGISTTLGYQNRNIFRGAELFDMSFTFGYEFLKVNDTDVNRNSIEVGGRIGVTIPQFLFPVNLDPSGKLRNQQTRIEFSISDQNRRYYHRVLSSVTFGYSWSDGHGSIFSLRPFDISLVKVNYVSQTFLDKLQNPYLKDSYTTQMMAGISGGYFYGDQNTLGKRYYRNVRANFSTSGNAISACMEIFGASKTDGHYTAFGIPYAQYLRGDISYAQSFGVGEKSSFAYRFFGGLIYPYGNSRHESLPADRLFYAGGINSMRGWTVRTLGPGGAAEVSSGYPSQFGNMRLEANAELRFPIWGIFDGATFIDAGNVWYTPDINNVPTDSEFRFNTFLPQIALNTGLGLRLNLNVLVLRLDWGVQLYNPDKTAGNRWVIGKYSWSNTALNFGIGYPF